MNIPFLFHANAVKPLLDLLQLTVFYAEFAEGFDKADYSISSRKL